MPKFDIVICHGPNDADILDFTLSHNKKNVIGYENIYVITYDNNLKRDDCIVLHESIFGFDLDTIKKYINSTNNRHGWYLQQLLKFYAHKIKGINEYYLIIDCDTFFIRETKFFENDIPLYSYGTEYHLPYFEHMLKLLNLNKVNVNISGICHHMIISCKIMSELFDLVINMHKKEFWESYLLFISPIHYDLSGSADYEIYFNYIYKFHIDKMKIRKLEWINQISNLENYQLYSNNFDFISYHHYNRN